MLILNLVLLGLCIPQRQSLALELLSAPVRTSIHDAEHVLACRNTGGNLAIGRGQGGLPNSTHGRSSNLPAQSKCPGLSVAALRSGGYAGVGQHHGYQIVDRWQADL